jgi:hypothetical protein
MPASWRHPLLWAAAALAFACDPGLAGPNTGTEPVSDKRPHRKRGSLPEGTHEGAGGSLLAAHAERDPFPPSEIAAFKLTGSAKTLAVAMLTVAAKDRIEDLPALLAPEAGFGLPDPGESGSRTILADGGEAFLAAFRTAASRFKAEATFTCPPILPALETFVATGAEPMWCFYGSDDRLDLLVFKLMATGGHARIAYVGLFDERPTAPVRIGGGGAPPPTTIPLKRRGMDAAGQGPLVLPEGVEGSVEGAPASAG